MSTSYYIGPLDPTYWNTDTPTGPEPTSDLRIDPEAYRVAVIKKWPFAQFLDAGPTYALAWTLDTADTHGPEGGLQSDLQHVSLRNPGKETLVDFALWHRTLIPSKYILYVSDSSSPRHLLLLPNTTSREIENYYSSH